MEGNKTPKKPSKRKHSKISKATVSESDESDHEITDFNGTNLTLNDESIDSDGGWSTDEDQELVKKVKETTKEQDKVSYKTRLKQLDWRTIAFKAYSADECEKRFHNHLKHVRRHRNLSEITTDIETNIKKCPLKKPLNAYQLFVQDQLTNVKSSGDFSETMKNLATLYKELSAEDQASYKRRAEELREEYKIKKQQFKSGIVPKLTNVTIQNIKAKTPYMLFAESKQGEHNDLSTLREAYANLSLDEKYKWVVKAVSEAQNSDQDDVTKILNKEEQRIFKGLTKVTPSAYSLYVKDTYNKIKDAHNDSSTNVFTQIARCWKSLDPKKKKTYMDAAVLLKERAAKEQEAFNERHGVTPKKRARRKSTFIEHHSESDDEDVVEKPTPRKRKIPVANFNETISEEKHTKQIKLKSPTKAGPLKAKVKVDISPVKIAQSPVKIDLSPIKYTEEEKKKKTKETVSESSQQNDVHAESDATQSSGSTSSKKKHKKEKKEKKVETVEPPGEKPPSSEFKYFVKYMYTGKPHKARKAFGKMTKRERKHLAAEFNEKAEAYVEKLRKYVKSLPKDEAVAYIKTVKAADEAEEREINANNGGSESSQEY